MWTFLYCITTVRQTYLFWCKFLIGNVLTRVLSGHLKQCKRLQRTIDVQCSKIAKPLQTHDVKDTLLNDTLVVAVILK